MLKPVIRSSILLMLVAFPSVFAEESLSTFNQQGEISYATKPLGQEAYYAEKAPLAKISSGYFGLDFGPNVSSLRTEATINNTSTGSNNKAIISYGITGFGGYGTNFNHLYLGSEFNVYYNFLDKSINNTVNTKPGSTSVSIKVRYPLSVGLDFIPGYITDSMNFLLYGRLGVGLSWTKLNFIDNTNKYGKGVSPSSKTNNFVFGLRVGGGVEYFVSTNFGIRLEYLYVGYNKVSGDPYTDSNVGKSYSYRLGGTGSHQVKLGLLVHF